MIVGATGVVKAAKSKRNLTEIDDIFASAAERRKAAAAAKALQDDELQAAALKVSQ